jgi:hypothetical protein
MIDLECNMIEIVTNVLHKRLALDELILTEENWDKPLTCNPFNLSGVMMCYLLFEIENYLNIRFRCEEMNEYGFSSIRKIAQLIQLSNNESYHRNNG